MQDVCLVVPCYNEANRLNAAAFLEAVSGQPRLGLCFVNDGSSDDTARVLRDVAARAPDRIAVLSLDRNQGKAEAVRRGMLHAAGDARYAFIGYWDADLSTPLSEVPRLLGACESHQDHLAAIGSRLKRLSADIDRNGVRHLLGRVFATLASLTLDLPVYDSQCGAKLFRSTTISWLFGEPFVSTWCFDVEILARMSGRLGTVRTQQAVVEVPLIEWHEVAGSKLRLSHMAAMPFELWRIRMRHSPRPLADDRPIR
jgi:glycosyltransferase involved in cell wall biosynthesis